jgi:hypothetical protein
MFKSIRKALSIVTIKEKEYKNMFDIIHERAKWEWKQTSETRVLEEWIDMVLEENRRQEDGEYVEKRWEGWNSLKEMGDFARTLPQRPRSELHTSAILEPFDNFSSIIDQFPSPPTTLPLILINDEPEVDIFSPKPKRRKEKYNKSLLFPKRYTISPSSNSQNSGRRHG